MIGARCGRAFAASKTLTVPSTLTRAPSGGSARQNGTCSAARWITCVMPCSSIARSSAARSVMSPATCGIAATASASSSSRSRRGSVERSNVTTGRPSADELGRDPGADAAVGAGDEEARVAHAGASTTFGVLGRPVDEVRERLGALGQRRGREPVERQVALGQHVERARELGARVGELAAQRHRAADEHGHRERRLGVAEPEHHDRPAGSARPRAPRATSARSRPRRRRGRSRPDRARPRCRRRRAARRSRAARPADRRP